MDDALPGLQCETVDDVVIVSGEVDAHTAPTFEAHLLAAPSDRALRLDLGAVAFMDSSGLRVLVDAHQRMAKCDHPLVLVRPSRPVMRLIEISGLSDHLSIETA